MEIKSGQIWKHYKGGTYEIIGVGFNSETLEEVVVYRALYGGDKSPLGTIWVRPKQMWFEELDWEGKKVKRFELV